MNLCVLYVDFSGKRVSNTKREFLFTRNFFEKRNLNKSENRKEVY